MFDDNFLKLGEKVEYNSVNFILIQQFSVDP